MPQSSFHRVTIRGIDFDAHLSPEGPYLSASRDARPLGGVVLGDATFVQPFSAGSARRAGLWLAKRGGDPRIHLEEFGDADLATLLDEFALGTIGGEARIFQECRAWHGLVEFVRTRPKIAARHSAFDRHVPYWHSLACDQAGLRPAKGRILAA